MLQAFRAISIAEGISLVLLFFVAMPVKYYLGNPVLVPYVGMAHGVLFLIYVFASLITAQRQRWSLGFWLLALLCSFVPFAFIWLERRLQAEIATQNST